jgi:uncharacterized protein
LKFSGIILGMTYYIRNIEERIIDTIDRGKSVLLFGPRQAGKTTMISRIKSDLSISLLKPALRVRYEKDPSLLEKEVESLFEKLPHMPLVVIDEIQKIPHLTDSIQYIIDQKKAQFILTGSSARKFKRHTNLNLLPGRVVQFFLDPFALVELPAPQPIEHSLLYGCLPGIVLEENEDYKEDDLESYVISYLEEEIRAEALVRNIGAFSRFLELAGIESGNIINMSKISQEVGVSSSTIQEYFYILEDCLLAKRIPAYTHSLTRKKLSKSAKYLIFDLGVRRICSKEGVKLSSKRLGQLFEQYVGLELLKLFQFSRAKCTIYYWRSHDGPEIDYVIEVNKQGVIPVEVKWTDTPSYKDCKHLHTFINEYEQVTKGFVVCTTPHRLKLSATVDAIPWQMLGDVLI